MLNKKIFITGGAGYVGCRLVPYLLDLGYEVSVYDIMYFTDNFLPKDNKKLTIVNGDIRDKKKIKDSCKNHDIFIHLACISNDASYLLDPELSKTVNYDCFKDLVISAKENKIKRFIYASTSSVYGISNKKDVKEDHPLLPLTDYNKYKGLCEPILLDYSSDDFETVIFRPATVCGYSPRMRFDLSVNILTCNALVNNKIKVFGGNQLRPNLHIKDYCKVVELFIEEKKNKVNNQIFNVGYQNLSIIEIANLVKKTLENKFDYKNIEIIKVPSNDNRSYHINSDKINKVLNFSPKFSIENGIEEIVSRYKSKSFNDPLNNIIYHNVKTLLKLKAE